MSDIGQVVREQRAIATGRKIGLRIKATRQSSILGIFPTPLQRTGLRSGATARRVSVNIVARGRGWALAGWNFAVKFTFYETLR